MPFHHVGLPVGDHYTEMRDFYKAILAPLRYTLKMEGEGTTSSYCGFADESGGMDFWLGGGCKDGLQKYDGKLEGRVAPVHIAFGGRDRAHVDEWYENAM